MNKPDKGGKLAEKARKKQPLTYHEGGSESENDPSAMRDAKMKTPYGGSAKSLAANAGKLGEVGESDELPWMDSLSPLNASQNGTGVTIDENYGVKRPRTQKRQEERFRVCNPEFQDEADEGDWTSAEWRSDV